MGRGTKVTISLDNELLAAVERERRARRQTRSEFFRAAAEQLLSREQEAIARYIRGYQECPETDEEIALAAQLGRAILAEEPWDETG